jgi:hypothetical protein
MDGTLLSQTIALASSYIHVIGWSALVIAVWRVSRFITKVETRATAVEGQINTLSTNHFPHMEKSLANQDGLMHEMNESLKTIALQTAKKPRR